MGTSQPNDRVRIFTVALDTFPALRVDITELFDTELAARGFDLDWAMWRREPGPGGVVDLPGGHHCVLGAHADRRGLLWKLKAWLAFLLRIVRQIKVARYDIVQVRDMPLVGLFVLAAGRLFGCKFTYWMSYPMAESRKYRAADPQEVLSRPKRAALRVFGAVLEFVQYKIVLPAADHVFVQSEKMASDVAARGIARTKLTPVPMGVLLDDLPPRPEDDPFAGTKAIVHLGTLIRVRRPEFLVDVLGLVRREVPEALLVLIGDAPEDDMAILREAAAKSGHGERVRFLGALPRAQALALTRCAAVCVSPFPPHPLNDSTSPTKLIEYLALGRPAVVSDHPDQSRVIAESGAGISVPYEAPAFARAIVELLQDRDRAEAMARKGPDYVARCRSYGALADEVERVYRALRGPRTSA